MADAYRGISNSLTECVVDVVEWFGIWETSDDADVTGTPELAGGIGAAAGRDGADGGAPGRGETR